MGSSLILLRKGVTKNHDPLHIRTHDHEERKTDTRSHQCLQPSVTCHPTNNWQQLTYEHRWRASE